MPWAEESCAVGAEEEHEEEIQNEFRRRDRQGQKRTGGVVGMKWPVQPIGEVFDVARGGSPRPIQNFLTDADDGINWIMISDATEGSKYITNTKRRIKPTGLKKSRMVHEGDFLLTNSMSFGHPYILKTSGCIHDGWLVLSPREKNISRDFFYYLLGSDVLYSEFSKRAAGAVVKNLNIEIVKSVQIPLPPLAEQKRIAAVLDAADALRAKRREAIAQLDALLQSTFLTLFGDPVSNPMGWEQVKLGDLIAVDDRINYGVVQPGDEYPGGKPLIRVGDFVGGELDLSGIKFIDPKIDSQYVRSRLLGTELLVSCVGSIGTVCRVPIEAKGHNIARAVARVPLGPRVEREFMLFCLRSAGVQNYFASETRTVSQPTLNIGLIKTATVTVPPLPLQQKFTAIVESIERQKTTQRAHLAELNALFAALQHRAFRGEL